MINIVKDKDLENRFIGVIEVKFSDNLNIDRFKEYVINELKAIKSEKETYNRDEVFKSNPYYKYFKKFKKTYPVMMQYESFLNGREFPLDRTLNIIPFLNELRTHTLLGAHDADCVEGDLVFYNEEEKRPFPGMFNKDAHSYKGDITGKDDKGIIISMIGGADDRTCLHDNTNHGLYLVFGTEEINKEYIENIINKVLKDIKLLDNNAVVEYKIY